jgi:hypothetical protein
MHIQTKGERKMKRNRFNLNQMAMGMAVFIGALSISLYAQDQEKAGQTNMDILRDKIKADKKLVVAANMNLTAEEAKVFWPVYEDYQKDLAGLNERLKTTIESYADAYNKNTLTDEMAKKLMDEAIAIDESELQMRKDYAKKLAEILPGKKVTRYLQIENKIRAIVRYGLAGEIPLVE